MSTMLSPEAVPDWLLPVVEACNQCEADRRPRMFICAYHDGYLDGLDRMAEHVENAVATARRMAGWKFDRHDCLMQYPHGGVVPWTCPTCGRRWTVSDSKFVEVTR